MSEYARLLAKHPEAMKNSAFKLNSKGLPVKPSSGFGRGATDPKYMKHVRKFTYGQTKHISN